MTKNKSAQVSVIALWVLIILAIMAVSVGRRVSLGLRLSGYQRDSLKAFYLAKAGLNRSIVELQKYQVNPYSSLSESWSTGIDSSTHTSILREIAATGKPGESFNSVIIDEESKLNLNIPLQNNFPDQLVKQILSELIVSRDQSMNLADAGEISDLLADWIDDDSNLISGGKEDASFKNKKLDLPEEFLNVLEYYYQSKRNPQYRDQARILYNKIKDMITVFGSGEVNLNTVSPGLLSLMFEAQRAKDPALLAVSPELLAQKIVQFRQNGIFDSKLAADIANKLALSGVNISSEEQACLSGLERYLCVKSSNFLIESTGVAGNVSKKILALAQIQNTLPGKIIAWYQN